MRLGLRGVFVPRLWWVLVFPFFFFLTRKANLYTPPKYDNQGYTDYTDVPNAERVIKDDSRAKIENYVAFGIDIENNTYQVMYFISTSCLVVGCYTLGRAILLRINNK